jgi:phage repressor protein C with HTH and peptisase S24 domain
VDNSDPPNKIRALRIARDWSQEQLASAVRPKTSQPQIDRLERGERRLTQEWMARIAAALHVDPAALLPDQELNFSPRAQLLHQAQQSQRGGRGLSDATVAPQNQTDIEFVAGGHSTFAGPRDLPILGYVKAGELGFFVGNGDRQGVTVRPESLRDVSTAYAVRVHDESMKPALKPGYLLYVDPTRPVKPGDYVVIQLNDGQAFIKHLIRRTEKAVICEQFNPAGEIKYPPSRVNAVHLVVQVSMIDL